jgi:plasmid rolling circle replication initiator protein Rep
MIRSQEELLEEIRNMRKEFQELLQLKLIEFMVPTAKPTKREKNVIRNINKMKF